MSFKLVTISPLRLFKTQENFWELIPLDITRDINLTLFNLPKVCAVVNSDNEIDTVSTLYLTEQAANGRSTQGATAVTYGENLVAWLNYLQFTRNKCTEDADEQDAQLFRNSICHKPKKNGQPYADNTINLRVKTPIRFHGWAQKNNLLNSALGEWAQTLTNSQQSAWIRRQRIAPIITRKIPKVLTVEELRGLFKLVGKPYSLIFKWAVVSGLRRSELCDLKKRDLPSMQNIETNTDREMTGFDLIRKGGRKWTVYAPLALIEETHWYLTTERPRPRDGHEDYVFLSSNGYQMNKGNLSRAFRHAANLLNSKATLHHLRHTYAVIVLKLLQQRAELGEPINPLKTLQILMGHASIDSTVIYLEALDVHSDAVEEALSFLYGAAQ